MKHQNARLEIFLSLTWYEVALRFLFTFVAKTSEILLAAGLVVSTANFLTDGSILATYPDVSIAWAWAQALAIDSSLGVSLSYALQCLKQEEWIRGVLYSLLTLLLAGVAGGITTIDIVSHALHLPMNDAMAQIGFNVMILSRLRAVAVIGFILMGRLRDLPLTTTETEPTPSLTLVSGSPRKVNVQIAIQSLCSQFSAEEMAQVLNGCIAAKKLVLVRVIPEGVPEHDQPHTDRQGQSQTSEDASKLDRAEALQGEPEPRADTHVNLAVLEPASPTKPSKKTPAITEPQTMMERSIWKAPEPIDGVSVKELVPEQKMVREPQDGFGVLSQFDEVPSQDRLEQAYQSLVAEGKKPSGRALAERAHVHRSTCVEWLRMKQQQGPDNELLPEKSEHDDLLVPDTSLDIAVPYTFGKVPAHATVSMLTEPPDTAIVDMSKMELNQSEVEDNVPPDVFPDILLPEDTPDA